MSVQEIIHKHAPRRDNLLLILHDLQDNHPQRYLSEEALISVARYLNITRSAVFGVATYYSMFSLQPRGKYIIRVCVSAVCELMKFNTVFTRLESLLGIKTGETTPCGLFTLEKSECLGQCQEAPSMMINDQVYNNLDEQRIEQIIATYRKDRNML
jgi:NADH-quinone oxidoreductase subunit E